MNHRLVLGAASCLLLTSSTVCAEGLKTLESPHEVSFQIEENESQTDNRELLNSWKGQNIDQDELQIVVALTADMTVPEVGVTTPMKLEYEAELSGWYWDAEHYVMSGQKSVGLFDKKDCIEEFFFGTEEQAYHIVDSYKQDDAMSSLPEAIAMLSEKENDEQTDLDVICRWINRDLDMDSSLFVVSDTTDNSRSWTLKENAGIEGIGSWDHYRINTLSIQIISREVEQPRQTINDVEAKKLETLLNEDMIRSDYRDQDKSEWSIRNSYYAPDGSAYFDVANGRYLVGIKNREGAEDYSLQKDDYMLKLTDEGVSYEVTTSSTSVRGSINQALHDDSNPLGTFISKELVDGEVSYNGMKIPFAWQQTIVEKWNDEYEIEEEIFSGLPISDRNVAAIKIKRRSESNPDKDQLERWSQEEVEQLLELFMQQIIITKGK